MLAMFLGMQDLIDFCIDCGGSTYYLRDFVLTEEIAYFLARAGLSSRISETALHRLVSDDRLPLVRESIMEDLESAMARLGSVADSVWRTLAPVSGGKEPARLRHDVLLACHVQYCNLVFRFSAVDRYPWCLVADSEFERNLDGLHAFPAPPAEDMHCAGKILHLLHKQYPRSELIAALRILSDVSWSTARVEQGHVYLSRVRRHHCLYGDNVSIAHSFISTLCPPFRPDELELKLRSLDQRMAVLARKATHYIIGPARVSLRDRRGGDVPCAGRIACGIQCLISVGCATRAARLAGGERFLDATFTRTSRRLDEASAFQAAREVAGVA